MANLNKVVLIGRLTRDPESRSFQTGGKVTKLGFAVTNRRRTKDGQWEDEPMFIDVEVYNRGEYGKLADMVAERCRKGTQICIEGRLHLDQWDDKATNQKRSKHKIIADAIHFLDPRGDGQMGGGGGNAGGGYNSGNRSGGGGYSDQYSGGGDDSSGPPNDDIPF